jgi:hypothetical protein
VLIEASVVTDDLSDGLAARTTSMLVTTMRCLQKVDGWQPVILVSSPHRAAIMTIATYQIAI